MKKRFRAKRKTQKKLKLLFSILILIGSLFFLKWCFKIRFFNDSSHFVSYMLDSSFHLNLEDNANKIGKKIGTMMSKIEITNPISLLESAFGYSEIKEGFQDDYKIEELEKMSVHMKDPNPVSVKEPVIYIYNSHQLENYSDEFSSITNLKANVMAASYLLKDKLLSLEIPTIVEEADITDYMKKNNLNHNESYNASRIYVQKAMKEYPNLKLMIDLHRDAISKEAATAIINSKSCAKILFVVGLEYEGYEPNLELANTINQKIKEKYPTLTRGVMTKKGNGVNGIYNQDLAPHMILLELGSNTSTLEEVSNTIDLVGSILKESVS